jgi:hypothetical protein
LSGCGPPEQTRAAGACQPGRTSAMADLGLIIVTLTLFGLLALAVKGVERL